MSSIDQLQMGEESAQLGSDVPLASARPARTFGGLERMITSRLGTVLILAVLFLAAWLPRSLALQHFVTIDERKWLARSANFYQAVTHGDWAHTYQRGHPGVTVMWAGMVALLQQYPTYAWEAPGQFAWERPYFEAWLQENTAYTPLELLAAGRRVIVLVIGLILALSYLPLRRLVGWWPAALAILFIAWDPFMVGLAQELHPDGFVAVLTYLALIFFLLWLYAGQRWRDLIAAGVLMGLAWLTKTPAIFLVPTGGLLVGGEWLRCRQSDKGRARSLLVGFVLWGLLATVTFVVLWPAMWVNPLGTLFRMGSEMGEYVERHTTTNYFWGQPTEDPGPLLYPLAFLFRTTPAVLFGLVFAAVAGWRRSEPFHNLHVRQTAGALLLFALILTAGMTIGAKKFDRYLLPAFPAFDIVAALGWVAVGDWVIHAIHRWRQPHTQVAFPALPNHPITQSPSHLVILSSCLLVAFLFHGLPGFLHYPYYLTYFNPLMGGGRTAPQVLFIGWGEGLDETARWLNSQPDAEKLRVTAWYADGPFSYFFRGQAQDPSYSSSLFWVDNDFVVLYVNQWQRQLPSAELVDYFMAQPPAFRVQAGGLELARVYDLSKLVPPAFVQIGRESAADFDGKIRLSAFEHLPTSAQPGDQVPVTLYLQSLAPMHINYNILVRLVGPDGAEIWREEGWPWGAPTTEWPLRTVRPDGHTIAIPATASPGLYKLTMSLYDPITLDRLSATRFNGEPLLDPTTADVALIQVGDAPAIAAPANPAWHFGDLFALNGVLLPAESQPGAELALHLDWEGLKRSATDYTVFVHIVDANGTTVAQQDQPPLGGFAPTHLWAPGQRLVDERRIPLPADLAPGRYEVQVGLYTVEGGRLPVFRNDQPAGDSVRAGQFTVK